ncbi:hypothetical protein [Roseovarius sp.]|uniref:hypothetical protein n=1 Tax=Roseovarius sp. TaxID=1486281 RepID=UPI003303FEE3
MTAFPYDDPVWDQAPHCYGVGANVLLAELEKEWSDDAADYLFFSALLHQGTTYPASYLSIPHLLRLAENKTGEPLLMIANLLGGLALAGHQPAHTSYSGVSCTPDSAWLKTPIGQAAASEFKNSLPQIGALSIKAFKAHPSSYFASGLAAAEGEIDLAEWLAHGENGGFQCPTCSGDHEWWLLGTEMGIYRNDDVFGYSEDLLADYKKKTFENANSIAKPRTQPQTITRLKSRLGPLDSTTDALFRNYKATVVCAHCAWTGEHPQTHPG